MNVRAISGRSMAIRRATVGTCLGMGMLLISCGQHAGDLAARVTAIAGSVQVWRYGKTAWEQLDTAHFISFGDTVRVLDNSYLELTFGDSNTLRLDENTKACFNDVIDTTARRVIEVFEHYGMIVSTVVQLPEPYELYRVRTPDAVAEVAGTQFSVRYELHTRTSDIDVVSGEVVVSRAPERDTVVVPVIVPAGYCVAIAWGDPIPPPEKIGFVRWRRLERVMVPVAAVRRPMTVVAFRPRPLRRLRRVAPGRLHRPPVVVPSPGRPSVRAPSAKSPRVLRPVARPGIRRSVHRDRTRGVGPKAALKGNRPGTHKSRAVPAKGKRKIGGGKGGKDK